MSKRGIDAATSNTTTFHVVDGNKKIVASVTLYSDYGWLKSYIKASHEVADLLNDLAAASPTNPSASSQSWTDELSLVTRAQTLLARIEGGTV